MDPAKLRDNPHNWRTHPEAQTGALAAALEQVGWAGALLYNEKTKRLIDGHARKSVAKGGKVPVLVGSWTEEQEKLILATLDPLAAMAGADAEALDRLLRDVSAGDERIDAMLKELAAAHPTIAPLPAPGAGGDTTPLSLAERFLVPPFSVLDARQGYWQDRKRAWLALGIRSELGRGNEPPARGGGPETETAWLKQGDPVAGRLAASCGEPPGRWQDPAWKRQRPTAGYADERRGL